MAQINVNGSPIVYNNAEVFINGSPDGMGINGYILGINYGLGSSSAHVQTLNPQGDPITVNRINSSPSGTITFAPSGWEYFWELLNNRNQKFDLAFSNYVTGQAGENTHTSQMLGVMLDDVQVSAAPMQPNSVVTFKFNATKINF